MQEKEKEHQILLEKEKEIINANDSQSSVNKTLRNTLSRNGNDKTLQVTSDKTTKVRFK